MDEQCPPRLKREAQIVVAEHRLGTLSGLARLEGSANIQHGVIDPADVFRHPYQQQSQQFKHAQFSGFGKQRTNRASVVKHPDKLSVRRRAKSLGERPLELKALTGKEASISALGASPEKQQQVVPTTLGSASESSFDTLSKNRSVNALNALSIIKPLRKVSLVVNPFNFRKTSQVFSPTPHQSQTSSLHSSRRASFSQVVRQVKNSINKGAANSKQRSPLLRLTPIGEDWLYLALLGIIMAVLSFLMDTVVSLLLDLRLWFFEDMQESNYLAQFFGWCLIPILLVTLSSAFVHVCSPTAVGSGIPEMKTILRGVVLNEYLTFRTLISKIVGLTFTLGSGLPLGKEGPCVHIASIVATLLGNIVASFKGIYENESRTSEMLSAACAVGVAATFYAPIGGVLFSIEVTTVYFAVRNYWRGFFAACCGATVWRLLGYWMNYDESVSALFKTNFNTQYPFEPIELLAFCFVGATCGLGGAAYVRLHRDLVLFFRRHKTLSDFFQQNRFIYPIAVTLTIAVITFPPFLGQFIAATLNTHTTIEHMFSNRTWSLGKTDLVSKEILDNWTTSWTPFHLHLALYMLTMFSTSILASTIPTPSGIFIPVLKIGAAYGRLVGELMHMMFPFGIRYAISAGTEPRLIVPGSYAVAGAAAFSGSVTHTISTSVILFEMTGQIVHIIPVILAVLVSNAVCQSLEPSIYDSMIEIKKLPYLPPIASSNSVSHKILVRDFMNTQIEFVWKDKCNHEHIFNLLANHPKLNSFPLVESPTSMKLLGSVPRTDLLKLLYLHLGRERRLQEVQARRISLTTMTSSNSGPTTSEKNDTQIEQLEGSYKPAINPQEYLPGNQPNTGTKPHVIGGRKNNSELSIAINLTETIHHLVSATPKSILKTSSSGLTLASASTTNSMPYNRDSFRNYDTASHQQQTLKKTSSQSPDGASELSSSINGSHQYKIRSRRVRLPQLRVVDMSAEEQREWENEQLKQPIDVSDCEIDEAPFQLVQQTSLYRVHTLFSMLGLSHAYVTSFGRLVGIVALKDIRLAVERMME